MENKYLRVEWNERGVRVVKEVPQKSMFSTVMAIKVLHKSSNFYGKALDWRYYDKTSLVGVLYGS